MGFKDFIGAAEMSLKLREVVDRGNAAREVVVLDVAAPCNLSNFLLLDSTYTAAGTQSNKHRHVFWFPDRAVVTGDVVNVYTRKGQPGVQSQTAPKTGNNYILYWNLDVAVWNNDQDRAILVQIAKYHSILSKKS